MLFSSSVFLFLFLPVVLLVYYLPLRRWRQGQNVFLLLASLGFYAWGEPWFVLVMLGSILANYGFGLWVDACKRAGRTCLPPLVAALAVNLGILFVFKYLTFTLGILNRLGAAFVIPGIELPIGISFFTFQALSYVLDVHRDRGEVQRSPLKVGLYISFFPQLIAGPIVKYETVAQQIDHRKETWTDFSAGCSRFIVGLGKKVLLSNQLAVVADRAFGLGDGLSASFAWLGALCYTLQIYYDFSGYSDMAIGLGKMFGFHFLENFNYPYISRSITEFWRRWHISLSTWFRDYVYFPLGGSRVDSRAKHIRNLFVVWLLTGIWHGANWTFLAWGLFYFVLLVLEKYGHLGRGWPVWAKWLFTFLMVNFAWVLFRADSLAAAGQYLQAMFGLGAGGWDDLTALYLRENWTVLAASVLFGGSVWRWNSTNSDAYSALVGLLSLVYTAVIIGTVVVTIMTIVQRFYRNLLGREGYLMHTLPVTETQLVTSKLISSTVWSLCSILAACLSFGILAVLMMADMDLLEQLPRMWSGIREAFARCNMEFWEALAFSGVVGFVRMVSAIACIYAACMVGHQFKNHPALAGILSFFVMQYVQGWLEKLLQIGTGVYETAIYSAVGDVGSIETTVSALGYMGSAMVTLGIAAAFGVFWFGLTVWLMRNKLNLE